MLALQSGQRRSASATFGVSDRACSDSYRSIFTGAYEVAAAGRHHMLPGAWGAQKTTFAEGFHAYFLMYAMPSKFLRCTRSLGQSCRRRDHEIAQPHGRRAPLRRPSPRSGRSLEHEFYFWKEVTPKVQEARFSKREDLSRIGLVSCESPPGPGHFATFGATVDLGPTQGERLQLDGGTRPGPSWSLLLNLPPCMRNSFCAKA